MDLKEKEAQLAENDQKEDNSIPWKGIVVF
jgi:hypothetical protein